MKSTKMNFAVNYARNIAITMALLGCLISWAAPAASAQVVGWAVGENGTILHSTDGKGQTWNEETLANVGVRLRAVTSFDGKKAWAVGDTPNAAPVNKGGKPGTILYFDGTKWAVQDQFLNEKGKPFVPNVNFNAVFALDNSHVWVVGDALTILYYNGKNWQLQPVGIKPPPNLSGVFFTEKAGVPYGWAVGGNGLILHYDGKKKAWATANGSPKQVKDTDFTSISGYGDVEMTHVVAVGALGIWRSDGPTNKDNEWSNNTAQLGNKVKLTVVQAFADNNKWIGQAATEPNVFQWNGKKWTGRPTTA